jgi:hypothetical protein
MIVTFFNASGIDFGNFLNAHLNHFHWRRAQKNSTFKIKILSTNYVTSLAMTQEPFVLGTFTRNLAARLFIYEKASLPILNLSVTIPGSICLINILAQELISLLQARQICYQIL